MGGEEKDITKIASCIEKVRPFPRFAQPQLALEFAQPQLALEFYNHNQLQLEWEGQIISSKPKLGDVGRQSQPDSTRGKPSRPKLVRKWTKLKTGLFGWRVQRESTRQRKDDFLGQDTTNTHSELRWQPKLDLTNKGVTEEKLGNAIKINNKRKQVFPNRIEVSKFEESKYMGEFNSDTDTDLDGIKRRKCPVGV